MKNALIIEARLANVGNKLVGIYLEYDLTYQMLLEMICCDE